MSGSASESRNDSASGEPAITFALPTRKLAWGLLTAQDWACSVFDAITSQAANGKSVMDLYIVVNACQGILESYQRQDALFHLLPG